MNQGFLNWYYGERNERVEEWKEWIESSDANRSVAEEAIYRLGLIRLMEENGLAEWQISNIYDRIVNCRPAKQQEKKRGQQL